MLMKTTLTVMTRRVFHASVLVETFADHPHRTGCMSCGHWTAVSHTKLILRRKHTLRFATS